jgi:hypothetical protein
LALFTQGEGQIMALSNITVTDIEKKWAGFSTGDSITRRIYGPEANAGHYLKFSRPK